MTTPRLYFDDPLALTFTARVLAHATHGGAPALVLDRTAFYPEAGGQLGDRGVLGGAAVRDVQVADDGTVYHLVEGALPEVGAEVTGEVDRARRRLHMALHTAQHMLSRALLDVARAETVSSRLGETQCTVDVDRAALDERDVARAEELVNAVVDDDLVVRAYFPTPAELAGLPLRRAPKVADNVRVVDIAGWDVSPCGGTHCTRTAQVGVLRVASVERYKGGTRVTFSAGRRARAELAAQSDALRELARELTCGPQDVGAALARLRRELSDAREAAGRARTRLAESAATELLARADATGDPRAVAAFDDVPVEFLRAVAARVTSRPDAVAILAARNEDGTLVVVGRGAASAFDCGAFLKRAAGATGGRGGGKPDRAEGKLPRAVDWPEVVAVALAG